MIFLYIFLGLIAVVFLFLLLPAHIRVIFDGELKARAGIGPVSFRIYPPKEKKKAEEKRPVSKSKNAGKKRKEEAVNAASELERLWKEEGWKAALSYLSRMASLLTKAAGRFLDILVIDRLYLDLLVASEDAAATATDYGKACAILYPALSLVKGRVKVRKSRLNIAPDFLREKAEIRLEGRAHVILLKALWQGLRLLMDFLAHTPSEDTSDSDKANERMINHGGKE